MTVEDLIANENTIIAMTNLGYIKRMSESNFKSQHRGGKGIKGMQTIEEDFIADLLMTTTHHYILFFTNKGKVYRLKSYEIPEGSRTSRGTAIVNLIQLGAGEKVTAIIPIKNYDDQHYLFMATKRGMVKKTPLSEYLNIRKSGLQAITLREGDELIEVKSTDDTKDIIMVTKCGQCIRFHETDVRATGRTSMGVIGMNLDADDEIVGMQLNTQGDSLLIVSEIGMGKKTLMEEFTPQNRGGKGVKCYKINARTGSIVGAKAVKPDQEILIITTEGIVIRLNVNDISTLGRITSGVKLIQVDADKDITVASFAKVREKPDMGEKKEMEQLTLDL